MSTDGVKADISTPTVSHIHAGIFMIFAVYKLSGLRPSSAPQVLCIVIELTAAFRQSWSLYILWGESLGTHTFIKKYGT